MTRKTSQTPAALDQLAVARAAAAQCADSLTQAQAAVERLDVLDAAEVAADPAKAVEVAGQRIQARELVSVYSQALGAAQNAVQAALAAALAADAEAMDGRITAAQAAVDAYDARVNELLDQLREHTGRDWERSDPARHRNPGQQVVVKSERNAQIVATLRRLQAQQNALIVSADGGDPTGVCAVEDLPGPLQASGYAPCAAVLALAQSESVRQAEEARQAADTARLADACRTLGVDPVPVAVLELDRLFGEDRREFLADAEMAAVFHRQLDFDSEALTVVADLASRRDAKEIFDHLQAQARAKVPADAA